MKNAQLFFTLKFIFPLLFLLAAGAFPLEAKAANFTVTNTVDFNVPGTLRDAVNQANASAADDTITFAIPEWDPGCADGVCIITLTSGGLSIQNNGKLTINAGSDKIIVSSNSYGGIFLVASEADIALNNLTVSGGVNLDGGGIVNAGILTITNSTISGNTATRNGGGIYNSGNLTITNSTISGNSASNGGGGIYNTDLNIGLARITGSTVTANSAGSSGGGILEEGFYSPHLNSTIVAGNNAPAGKDVAGFVVAGSSFNLIGDGTGLGGISNGSNGNQIGTSASPIDPMLAPLADNNGPTKTHALLSGSPAIDKGNGFGSTADQRGFPRPIDFPSIANASGGDASDIGAYEVQVPSNSATHFSVSAPAGVTIGTPFTFTVTALDANNNVVAGYNSFILFASSDAVAFLPPNQPAVMTYGTQTFTATMNTYGNQTISVTHFLNSSITGTSNAIAVRQPGGGIPVTRTDDRNGNCIIVDCSLREAIKAANALSGDNTITFNSTVFAAPQTITLTNGELVVQNNGALTINGADKLVVSGNNQSRVFNINSGANLTFNNLTVTGGNSSSGGGINNDGTLTINNSTVSGNSTSGSGGGINNNNSLTLTNATVSGNSAVTGGGIGNGGTTQIYSSTITGNSASAGFGGGINNSGDMVALQNTIIAGNTSLFQGPDFRNTITSYGYNLIGNPSGAIIIGSTTGNILSQNPQLDPLADNGGPTKTHRLRYNSPAIDKGTSFGLTTDQRGLPRPFDIASIPNTAGGDGTDIGAFERQSSTLIVSAPANAPAGEPFNVTVTAEPGYTGTIHFTGTDAEATLPADYTFVAGDNGTRQFSVALRTLGNQTITATDTANNTFTGSANTNVVPGLAVSFTVSAPTAVISGVPNFVTVTAFDTFGNIATGYTGTIHFTSTDPSANLPGDYTFNSGNHGTRQFFWVKMNTVGNQTITATDTANSTINGTSNTIIVQPASSNLVVTRTDDRYQNCSVGDCSLREAIEAANALPSDDTITFDPVVFAAPQTINLNSYIGYMPVNNNGTLTINGARKVTLTGEILGDRAFIVNPGANLTINDLNIDHIVGGGISSFQGTLTLNNSTISNCVTYNNGVGIYNEGGSLVVNNSTISGNTGTAGTNFVNGAGIYNSGTAIIRNSTIVENRTYPYGTSLDGKGGGIYNNPSTGGTVTIANTIVSHNRGHSTDDLYGAVVSQGYNLFGYIDPTRSPITGDTTGNIIQYATPIGPLADNGGGVKTHALLPGSPAIDAGKSFGAGSDQRGFTRPVDEPTISNAAGGDATDIGAFEVQANSFFVNTTADTDDGACTAPGTGNGCTLREAINAANSTATADTINFDATVFAATGLNTIQLTSALPALSTYITINGPGARLLAVRGEGTADPYTIFIIASGATVNISGLTITNGVPNSNGAAGGIYNDGTLTLLNSAVSGNPAGAIVNGSGGLKNNGTLTLQNSTVSGNAAGSVGSGGGIFNNSGSMLTLQNSTVSGNNARTGGGIHNIGTLTLQNSTVSGNNAGVRGGGIGGLATLTLRSSIVAGNSSSFIPDIDGTVQSDGYNLIGDTNGTTINQNAGAGPDITDVDAQLGALANNGGPTDTHALAPTSPAIDKGKSFGAGSDQRGLARPVDLPSTSNAPGGDGSDIGALETSLAPTAANVTVSGRVLTPAGRGLVNSIVTLIDQQGNSRSARTSSFGYFKFAEVATGETVVISITSKRYTFAPQAVTVYDEISDLNFVASEP